MDLLKRNLFWIVCAVVGMGGAALGVTGWQGMPKVKKEMDNAAAVFKSLDSLQSNPVNQESIDQEQARIDQIQSDFAAVLALAEKLYGYKPLVEGVFPDGPPLKRLAFLKKYAGAMDDLFAKLNTGDVPTLAHINTMKGRREDEVAKARLEGVSLVVKGPTKTAADVLTEAGIRDDPVARAAIANALSFYTYAVSLEKAAPPNRIASLEFPSSMQDVGSVEAPVAFDVWRAQLLYWIQKDVVEAIVDLNEASGVEARNAGLQRWVGTMAVKDVISIRVSDYVPPEGDLTALSPAGGYGAALPPGTGESVFTGSRSGPNYEVLQFSVKLVMDQRDIDRLVERICNNRFHTLVRASYVAVEPNRKMKGKIYGPEPVVNVVLDFETIMLGEVFRPLIPQETCDIFEIDCPQRETDEGEEG